MRFGLAIAFILMVTACGPMPGGVFQEKSPELRGAIQQKLSVLGPEQPWHANCLFSKPIAALESPKEQNRAYGISNLIFHAYWEEQRKAYSSAGQLYRQISDQGIALGFTKLGDLLINGLGTPRNTEGGMKLLLQSSRLDCAESQYLYGKYLSEGIGGGTLIDAWSWAEMASSQGHKKGGELQRSLTGVLGPSELALAKQTVQKIRSQMELIKSTPDAELFVRCRTELSPRFFVTRLRICYAIEGEHRAYYGSPPF